MIGWPKLPSNGSSGPFKRKLSWNKLLLLRFEALETICRKLPAASIKKPANTLSKRSCGPRTAIQSPPRPCDVIFERVVRSVQTQIQHDETEIEAAITALAREPGGGLIAAPDAFINNHRRAVITLTERHRLPAIYGFRQFVAEGALISYGPNTADIVRRSAGYVDRVLKGERPADLPVQAPTKYELVINLKTAKALGIAPAPGLLARVDGVIQ
jgi:hypothetical protein